MANAQLAATVYVTDPDTHQQVRLEPGTCPEPRLAALVKAKGAWVDGKMPRLPKTQTQGQDGAGDPTGDGPDDASGEASGDSDDADTPSSPEDTPKAATAAKKTAARKTAATKPAPGRDAADLGDSGA